LPSPYGTQHKPSEHGHFVRWHYDHKNVTAVPNSIR